MRRRPCWVIRQKWQTSVVRASNQDLANGWLGCLSNVRATQTLTSRSSIFLVQDLADPLVRQRGRQWVLATDQWHLDALLRPGQLGGDGRVGDGDGRTL